MPQSPFFANGTTFWSPSVAAWLPAGSATCSPTVGRADSRFLFSAPNPVAGTAAPCSSHPRPPAPPNPSLNHRTPNGRLSWPGLPVRGTFSSARAKPSYRRCPVSSNVRRHRPKLAVLAVEPPDLSRKGVDSVKLVVQDGSVLSRSTLERLIPLFPRKWATYVRSIVVYATSSDTLNFVYYPKARQFSIHWPSQSQRPPEREEAISELAIALSIVASLGRLPAKPSKASRAAALEQFQPYLQAWLGAARHE